MSITCEHRRNFEHRYRSAEERLQIHDGTLHRETSARQSRPLRAEA